MSRRAIAFTGSQHQTRNSHVNDQLTINWIPMAEDETAKNIITLNPTPGLALHTLAGSGPCRSNGIFWQKTNSVYFVSGQTLVQIDSGGNGTTIGLLDTQSGWCCLTAGRDFIMVTDGTAGYYYGGVSSFTFAKITAAGFPVPDYCEWLDTYFIVNSKGTEQFFISASGDPTVWNALDFASAEKRPDKVIRPIWLRGDLLMMGTETCELFYNSGNVDFPFSAFTNVIYPYGIEAPASADNISGANGYEAVFWLGRNRKGGVFVCRGQNEHSEIVSDQGLNWQFSQLAVTSDAVGFCYMEQEHPYYVLSFPNAKRTWVYDDSTGMWHERRFKDENRWRGNGHVFFDNKHIVGDFENNNFYIMSPTVYTDNGFPIIRRRRTSVVHSNRKTMFHNRLDIEFQQGNGLVTGQGSDPQAMLRWSDDGGNTFGTEVFAPIGKIGEYNNLARWHGLGSSRNRIYELTVSDPIEAVVTGAWLDYRVGVD